MDAVGVMVLRDPEPVPLEAARAPADVEIGLHLEEAASPAAQLAEFERLFGRPPAYVDGHRHCHANPRIAREVARAAAELAIPVRAVDAAHRRLLREFGVRTADRLVGRLAEDEPVIPLEVGTALSGDAPAGTTEWIVHPGHAGGPSSYDAGRERDLEALLRLGDRASWRARGVVRLPPSRLR